MAADKLRAFNWTSPFPKSLWFRTLCLLGLLTVFVQFLILEPFWKTEENGNTPITQQIMVAWSNSSVEETGTRKEP